MVLNNKFKISNEYIYKTLNYGNFRILERVKEENKDNYKYFIEFENTGNKKWAYKPSLSTGKIKDNLYEENRIKNEYVLKDTHYIIKIKDYEFLIDKEDYERCKTISWRTHKIKNSNRIYCQGYSKELKFISLHAFLMNFPEGVVDHENRNTFDNRKQNLRVVTSQNNSINSSLSKNNTSGFIGVWEQKGSKLTPYVAELMLNRKKIYREYFQTKEEAILGRLKAELKYFGKDFAPQRHLFEEYGIVNNEIGECKVE